MALLLDSLTMGSLKEISKLATKVIRKVPLENILIHTHEVAPYNPFYRYWEYLQTLREDDNQRS